MAKRNRFTDLRLSIQKVLGHGKQTNKSDEKVPGGTEESRVAYREPNQDHSVGFHSAGDYVFQVIIDPETRKITTNRVALNSQRGYHGISAGWCDQVAGKICTKLCELYGFNYRDLVPMSNLMPDGIMEVWVRSRVPIPPKRLEGGMKTLPQYDHKLSLHRSWAPKELKDNAIDV